jgi:hypothetical protein
MIKEFLLVAGLSASTLLGFNHPDVASATGGMERGCVGLIGIESCQFCNGDFGASFHWFSGAMCTGGFGCYSCEAFNSCHANTQTGPCGDWHWRCDLVANPLKGDDVRLAELAQHSPTLLIEWLRASNVTYEYNEERNAIQVADCSGRLAWNLPLGNEE